jgi:hypothetical protein
VRRGAAPAFLLALDRAGGSFGFLLSVLASTTIASTMFFVVADVLSRAFFNASLPGVADFVANAIVASVFVQLGSTIRNGRLISAEFLMGGWENTAPRTRPWRQAPFRARRGGADVARRRLDVERPSARLDGRRLRRLVRRVHLPPLAVQARHRHRCRRGAGRMPAAGADPRGVARAPRRRPRRCRRAASSSLAAFVVLAGAVSRG